MHPYGGTPICPRCENAVYAAEQIMGPGRMLYHKPCLACTSCNKRLDSLSLMEHDKEPYCKQCYNKHFGPRDLRQANLPHRDDIPLPLSSSPARPTLIGSPAKSFRSTSPTQEEKEVEARFERAKRGLPEHSGSPSPFKPNDLAKRAENFKQGSDPSKASNDVAVGVKPPNLSDDRHEDEGDTDGTDKGEATIPLTQAHTERIYNNVVAPNARPPPSFTGSPVTVHRAMRPTSPTTATAPLPSPPIRSTTTGTRYGAALLGSPQSTGSNSWTSRAMPGTGTPLCARCAKPVYFAEQVKANGRTFHKPCLRCTDCNAALDSSRLAEKGEKVVCRSCYGKNYGPQGSGYALLGKAGG